MPNPYLPPEVVDEIVSYIHPKLATPTREFASLLPKVLGFTAIEADTPCFE